MQPLKILLVQLGANGDCLFVTTIAKQIKEIDYPGCHLTWMIGYRYKHVIENNPFIDKIIEVPIFTLTDTYAFRDRIPELIKEEKKKYEHVFVTDYTTENYQNWYGTTRSSLFRSYPHKLKIRPEPLIFLNEFEKKQVAEFCKKHKITSNSFNILFECAPQSGQSKMTLEIAQQIACEIATIRPQCKFILSSDTTFESNNKCIIDASSINWRANAELVNNCNLFVGCSSGISWLCTTNWSKKIPFIQIINPGYMSGKISASVKMDFKYFGLNTSNIIEMQNPSHKKIVDCILGVIDGEFQNSKKNYDSDQNSVFKNYKFLIASKLSLREKALLLLKYHVFRKSIKSDKPALLR